MKTKKVPILTDTNPLADIVNDKAFKELFSRGLLNKIGIRNHRIKNLYKHALANGKSTYDAIEEIHARFAYLGFNSIKKIVSGKW